MGKWVDFYCNRNGDNKTEIEKLVDKIIGQHFPWIPQSKYDDCYSIAYEVCWRCELNYNEGREIKFTTYLIRCLHNKIKTRITYENREKRCGANPDVSIEGLMDEDEKTTMLDFLATQEEPDMSSETQRYLNSLSKKQRKIAELIMDGYEKEDIKQILLLTDEKYRFLLERMRDDRKTEILNRLRGKRNER